VNLQSSNIFSGYRTTPTLQHVAAIGGATSKLMKLRKSCWASFVAMLFITLALSEKATAFDVPLPPAPNGGTNEIKCERLISELLEPIPGDVWGGFPTYRAVKGGLTVHQCPPEAGEHLQIPREYYRNYQLTLRWTVRDASGYVVSTQLLPPYYLWGGAPSSNPKPRAPVLQLLADIRRALWGV
jgi:hypothetical protein